MGLAKRAAAKPQKEAGTKATSNFARRLRLEKDGRGRRRVVVDTKQGQLDLDQLPGQLALPRGKESSDGD